MRNFNEIFRKDGTYDNKCFQYAITAALKKIKIKEIKKNPEQITKIKPFIDKYNWEGINYPSEKDDWKKIEKNDLTMILPMLQNIIKMVKNKLLF